MTPDTTPAAAAAAVGTLAPIDAAALAGALQPFGRSTMLPASAYIDPAVFEWERRCAFADSWVCLGRDDELVIGDVTHQSVTVGDVPVLLTRVDGALAALANTCRHRGHELLADGCTSSARAITCPYHAWRYGLDGTLINAPRMRDVDGFDPADHALVPVPIATWQGWVMVNASGRGAPRPHHRGELDALVAPYAPASLRLGGRHEYVLSANWKVVAENYHECYHCPRIHPELCAVSQADSGDNWDRPGAWVGGSMVLKDGNETMSLDGRTGGVLIDGVAHDKVLYVGLFPNLLLSLHPDYVMTHRMAPLASDRTWIECSWFFPIAAWDRDGFDPAYAIEFWDLTNRQDWAACESVQRGLASPHFRAGPLAPNEDAVHQWITMVGRLYQGHAPHAGTRQEIIRSHADGVGTTLARKSNVGPSLSSSSITRS